MRRALLATTLLLCASSPALAQPEAERTHAELRALRDEMVAAANAGDVERLLEHATDDVVVTWHNAEVSRGHEAIREYYDRMVRRPGALIAAYSTEVTVDDTTIFYGDDAGVAYGSMKDHFELSSGAPLDLDGRWSATVVRQDGRWLVASFHTSTDLFDNAVLTKMKTTAYLLTVFGLVMGIVVGIGVAMFLGRKSAKR